MATIQSFNTPIADAEYLESLRYQNVKVTNFSPTRAINLDLNEFLSAYQERQRGIILRINSLNDFLTKNTLDAPRYLSKDEKGFIRQFMRDMDKFLSNSYQLTLSAKDIGEKLFKNLSLSYPHLESILLWPSTGEIYTFRMLKESEFVQGQNQDFVNLFCGGNLKLARKVAKNSMSNTEENERLQQLNRQKTYAMLEYPRIRLLDELLVVDNFIEPWIWKASWFTSPMWHLYNIVQEILAPTGKIKKDTYEFNIKFMKENL